MTALRGLTLCVVASAAALAASAVGGGAAAEDADAAAGLTVWDGVYPSAQAERGLEIYDEFCVTCHARGMRGAPGSPPLTGAPFLFNWDGRPLGALFEQVRDTMPVGQVGYLTDDELLDVIAAILAANGFPGDDGAADLTADADALGAITIVRAEPEP